MNIAAAVLLGCLALASQCDSKYVRPPSGPGTDYPCGLQSHLCSDRKSCCDNGYDCGGDVPNCSDVTTCCYNGGDNAMRRSPDAAAPTATVPKQSLP